MSKRQRIINNINLTQTMPPRQINHNKSKSTQYCRTHTNPKANLITKISKSLNENTPFTQYNSLSPKYQLSRQSLSLLPPQVSDKKTLVLDLDETLVHSAFAPFKCQSDIVIQIDIEGETHDIYVLVRPFVKEFLEKMSERFEITVFTASLSKYANPLLNIIDQNGHCLFRLFREHCTLINTAFVKDLTRLGRNMKDVIIMDNSPVAYALNQYNGFPIPSWFDNRDDTELLKVIPILEFLSYVPDVRVYLKQMISCNKLQYDKVPSIMQSYNNKLKNNSFPISMRNILHRYNNSLNDNHQQQNSLTNIFITKSMKSLCANRDPSNVVKPNMHERSAKSLSYMFSLSNHQNKCKATEPSLSNPQFPSQRSNNPNCTNIIGDFSQSWSIKELNRIKSMPCSYGNYIKMKTMKTNSSSKKIIHLSAKGKNIQINVLKNDLITILKNRYATKETKENLDSSQQHKVNYQ